VRNGFPCLESRGSEVPTHRKPMNRPERPAHARALAEAAEALAGEAGPELTTERICALAVELIAGCDHASITVRQRRGGFHTLASSSETAAKLDSMQFDKSQGPCLAVMDEGEAITSNNVETDGRWPLWAHEAAGLGARSVISIRLTASGQPIGAINLYSHRMDAWDADAHELALGYAAHAAIAMDAAQIVSGLHTALSHRHQIGLAQGILMVRHRLGVAQAFAVLQRYSNNTNTKLSDIAADLVRDVDPTYLTLPPRA
jgi:GAF domain-containing protein